MARGLNIKFGAQPYNLQASTGKLWVATTPSSFATTGHISGLVHGQSFTITGSGWGTKFRSPGPYLYDACTAPVHTIDPQWTNDNYPSTAGGDANIQLQAAGFVTASGFSPGTPDPFHSKIYSGTHLQTNTATGGNAVCRSVHYTQPTKPYPLITIYPYRADGNWAIDPTSDNNWKEFMYSMGSSMQPASGHFSYWCFSDASTGAVPIRIGGITNATNAVINTSSNQATSPLGIGTTIYVDSVQGMTQINQMYGTVIDALRVNTFWRFTTSIDTSTFGVYTSGSGLLYNPHVNNLTTVETTTLGKQGTTGPMMQDPDLFTGKTGGFYGQNLWPMNAANGWINKRFEQVISIDTTTNSTGYLRQYDNCSLSANYFGKTVFDDGGATTQLTVTIGQYARDRSPNNTRQFGRSIVDFGGTGDINVAHIMIGNAPTFAACTDMQYAVATAWSPTSITFTPWKGNFATGSTGYIYVYTATGGIPSSPAAQAAWQ